MKWDLTTKQDGEWTDYHLARDGSEVARAKWRLVNGCAELHNWAGSSAKSVLIKTREILRQVIVPDIKSVGATRIFVADLTANVDELRVKYWRFMGFSFGGEIAGYSYGVMEV